MDAKRVTLRDVAAAAGVSRATAGFVLSDAPVKALTGAGCPEPLAADSFASGGMDACSPRTRCAPYPTR
jgi:hypothetical protein